MLAQPTPRNQFEHVLAQVQAEQARRRSQSEADRVAEAKAQEARRDLDAARAKSARFDGFVRECWPILEPGTDLIWGWHIDAIAEHLEAVSAGQIKKLLINVSPAAMKSLLVSVMFPAWEWGPAAMPHQRFLTTSYERSLAIRDNVRMRRIIESDWYKSQWGDTVKLTADQNAKDKFENTAMGFREARAFMSLTGGRGGRLIVDDPHSTTSAESPTQRAKAVVTWREAVPSRLNAEDDAIICVMQRLNAKDVSGAILEDGGFEHLMIPMEFEPERKFYTSIGWADPRTDDGELMCPERFSPKAIEGLKKMGAYAWAGQYQQRPTPREGGMFKRAWFTEERCIAAEKAPPGIVWARHWDLAATKRDATNVTGARTAGVKLGRSAAGQYYVGGCIAKAIEGFAVRALIEATAAEVDGPSVTISLPQDPGQAGKVQKGDFITQLDGFVVRFLNEGILGDKEARAEPFAIQCEAGNVWIIGEFTDPWVQEWIGEMCDFPGGKRKDIPDATSGAYARISPRYNAAAGLAGPEVFSSKTAALANRTPPAGDQPYSVYD